MAGAQVPKELKAIKALSGQQVENAVTRAALRPTWPQLKSPLTTIQLIAQPTPPAGVPRLHADIVLSTPQHRDWLASYQQILTDFEHLKKESSTFLFYQSIPLEKRQLSTEETRQWLGKMLPLYTRILKFYLTTNAQDKALTYALSYVEQGLSVLDPYLVPTLRLTTQPLIAPFNVQEFFLYPPEGATLEDPSIILDGKKIAIVNDDISLLSHFERLAKVGLLFPGATLHTNGAPLQFLMWFQNTSPQPAIVFTDIQLGDANGYYIAHELRRNGYTGGIIALTSYTETEANARQLKAAGFDGMVSLDERYLKIPFSIRATQAAQVYLQRAKNN